jgi:ABC-type Fe3+-hydroxamate transport system substrate-binding protein
VRYKRSVPSLKLTDDLGRTVAFARPPQRIVSLVPSDTYTIVALGAEDRIVGRTTYCEHALGAPTVGGTKDVDVEAVIALAPQLVIANQEENTRTALEALAAAHVPVFVSLPRRVEDSAAHVARIARILGDRDSAKDIVRRGYRQEFGDTKRVRAFIPIWMDPLMTMNAETFGSDVLAHVGIENVFGDRMRLYPLAADLGKSTPQDAGGRDVRYPRVTIDEVVARKPDVILLPDEPHAFSADDEAVFRAAMPGAPIMRVSGKDLFWYGAWMIDALDRLAAQLHP